VKAEIKDDKQDDNLIIHLKISSSDVEADKRNLLTNESEMNYAKVENHTKTETKRVENIEELKEIRKTQEDSFREQDLKENEFEESSTRIEDLDNRSLEKLKLERKINISKGTKVNLTPIIKYSDYHESNKNKKITSIYNYTVAPELNRESLPNKTTIYCWWDCHPFDTQPIPLPKRYISRTKEFKVYGCFCSFNCALAYANSLKYCINFDLIKYMCKLWTNSQITTFKKAPPRESLQIFGGPLTIEEFRDSFVNGKNYILKTSPIISVPQVIEESYVNNEMIRTERGETFQNNTKETGLRLSRPIPLKTKHFDMTSFIKRKN
jgi:hypothetical protein